MKPEANKTLEIKKLSELIADFEKSTEEIKSELSEIKSTMVVNFSGGRDNLPKLLDGTEKTALHMFIKIIEHYHSQQR